MTQWEMLAKAIKIAGDAHYGQIDKSGMPYILHPMRVMYQFNDPYLMAIAVLHDVVEDTDVTLEDLEEQGMPERVIKGVQSMTHYDSETRDEYYARLKKNDDAREVKTKDILDNLSTERLKLLSQVDRIKMITKYGHALEQIYKLD